jgi:hypothetical protein
MENFSDQRRFFWNVEKKNGAVFQNIFEMVNLNEIFDVMKAVGKIHLGISFIDIIVSFHFHPLLEFSY